MIQTLHRFAAALFLAGVGCEAPSSNPAVTSTTGTGEPKSNKAPGQTATAAPTSAPALEPLFVSPADGEVWNLFGDQMIRMVAGKDTGGAYAVILSIVPPGNGPPPHLHHDEDELFMIDEGEFELRFGDEIRRGGPGTIAMLPRGIPHGFRNVGQTPGKLYIVITPARFEGFFADLAALPEKERGDLAKIIAIGKTYNLAFLPPSGGAAPAGTTAASAASNQK